MEIEEEMLNQNSLAKDAQAIAVPHQTLYWSRPCKRVVSNDIYYNLQAAFFKPFLAKIDPF